MIAQLLVRRGLKVRVLARDPAAAAQKLDSSIEIVPGDITREETLPAALDGARHIIFTAGCRSGRPVTERQIRRTEYDGVLRLRAESAIRESGLGYTIIRTGMLMNHPGGTRPLVVTQRALPLSPRYRIAREDVATVFVAALDNRHAARATFEVVWGHGRALEQVTDLLGAIQPDSGQAIRHDAGGTRPVGTLKNRASGQFAISQLVLPKERSALRARHAQILLSSTMIARVWRARAAAQLAHLYTAHFNAAVLPRLRALPGFRGAYLLQRAVEDHVEFVVQTIWDSMDAVKEFAGPDPGVAVVDEEARAVLISFDTAVQHYDVVVNP